MHTYMRYLSDNHLQLGEHEIGKQIYLFFSLVCVCAYLSVILLFFLFLPPER